MRPKKIGQIVYTLLGVLCYELMCGCLPWGEDTETDGEVLELIVNAELEYIISSTPLEGQN